MPRRLLLGLCAGILLLAARPGSAAFVPGDNPRTLAFGGLLRAYRVHVPPGYDGSVPVPLVVDIHGLGSNVQEQEVVSGMAAKANATGFLVVYPQGVDDAWNAGTCCGNAGIDDVGFMRALVAAVSAEANIDPRRVYATGLSNGGAMTQRLACDAADLFAAAAPMSFPIPLRPLSDCQPIRAMPVLTVMGLTDVLVRYNGGPFGSAPSTFAYWRDVDGCGDGAPDQVVERGQSRCETYTSCAQGVQAGLCSITANSFIGTRIEGHVVYLNSDFNLADVAWNFLSSFTLPDVTAPADSVLAGRDRTKIDGKRQAPLQLRWNVQLGAGTWGGTTADGTALSGSWMPKRRNRRVGEAELTSDSRVALSGALAARIGASAGTVVDLEPIGLLRVRRDRAGAATSLRGRFRILRDGAAIGRYELRLRRAR
jgi:polyhydroxybutyrate depolymerase